jgi:hypothetical protein
MKRHFALLIVVVALATLATPVESSKAESWIFGPPIYKRPKPLPVMVQPQADRGPYFTEPQGEFTGTSRRFMNSIINIQGETCDDYQVTQTYTQRGAEDE